MDIPYKIFLLGDSGASIEFGNTIDENINRKVLAIKQWINTNPFEGLKDIIIAYSSLSVYYDPIIVKKKNNPNSAAFEFVKEKLEVAYHQSILQKEETKKIIRVPVCYSNDFGIDIDYLVKEKNISKEELVHLHASNIYRVYMIGFLPGFCYLGKINEKLLIPRKSKPLMVAPGSVGIAGSQTGIYPMPCPGGWQIIGRTPMKFFDPATAIPVPVTAGDYVEFYEISKDEFESYTEQQGQE